MNRKTSQVPELTPEQRAQHRAIREAFRDWHPGPEELIASGAAAELGLNVVHSPAEDLLRQLKTGGEAAGLTLAEAGRCPLRHRSAGPDLAWKTGSTGIRRWIPSGVMPRPWANG